MPKNMVIGITASVFICFGFLLSIGIAMEASDRAYGLKRWQSNLKSRIDKLDKLTWQQSNLESRVDELLDELKWQQSDLESRIDELTWQQSDLGSRVDNLEVNEGRY